MPPERILEGRSSASFIQDAALLALLAEWVKPPTSHLASVTRLH